MGISLGGPSGSLLTLKIEDPGRLLRVLIREPGIRYLIPLECEAEESPSSCGDGVDLQSVFCHRRNFIYALRNLTTIVPQVSVSIVPDQVLLVSATLRDTLMQFYLPLVET
jgi:hypothetical protein